MPTRLTGRRGGTAYIGVEAPQPPNMLEYPRNPTTTDVFEYFIGDFWINNDRNSVDYQSIWYYASRLQNVATWLRLGGGAGALLFLTPDVGGAVFPLAGNININGLNGIVTTGNIAPASPHQITIGSTNGFNFVESLEGDDLVKVFADPTGNINTRGGATAPNAFININTFSSAPFFERFALNNSIIQPPTNASGTQGIYSLGTTAITTDRFLHNFGTQNTFVGYQSGNLTLTTADSNAGCGYQTLNALTTGDSNSAVGNIALKAVTTGSTNTGIGAGVLTALTTGSGNSSNGYASLSALITGTNNCALGINAGNAYTGAETGNIIIGANNVGKAGELNIIRIIAPDNTTGDGNVFIGQTSGNTTYTGGTAKFNTALGFNTMTALTTGSSNVAVGANSMGISAGNITGTNNVCVGVGSGQTTTSANNNVLVGVLAGTLVTSGSANTIVGAGSFVNATTAASNSTLGDGALNQLLTGTQNIGIGLSAGNAYTGAESSNVLLNSPGVIGESNVLRAGSATGTGAGQLNKAFICGIRGITTGVNDAVAVLVDSANQLGTVSSSIKYKTNIRPMDDESEDIFKLTPVVFNWIEDEDGPDRWGLIAEEVEGIMPGLVAHNDKGEPYSIKYHELPILLLNEIQKLKKDIDDLKKKLC